MDILDEKRIKAITPYYCYYHLQDLIPELKAELLRIRERQLVEDLGYKYMINKWTVEFDWSFDHLSLDTKLILIKEIVKKYYDFDAIIMRTSNRIKDHYCESGKSKLYETGIPYLLKLDRMWIEDNILRFRIDVLEYGKRQTTYHLCAGGFFILWDH
jgi:hypothetical protein